MYFFCVNNVSPFYFQTEQFVVQGLQYAMIVDSKPMPKVIDYAYEIDTLNYVQVCNN